MAVPSDDERDKTFATKFELPIIDVVDKSKYPGATLHDKVGVIINSGFMNGMEVPEAITAASAKVEEMGIGKARVNYKMRDANFSRQRYWGEPFPVKYDSEDIAHMISVEDLPLELPDTDDFKPGKGGQSPLSRLQDWVNAEEGFVRETDTMPAVAGSSWYYLRYMDPNNDSAFVSQDAVNYWESVDLYVGGSEHAVAHLMYARFWHKFLHDKGLLPTNEPFKKLINQGMIQGVIEFIFLEKGAEGDQKRFVPADMAAAETDKEFAKIPVHVDFVSNYGSPKSYLSTAGIDQFIEWRPEYSDAIFESESGTYQKGAVSLKDGAEELVMTTLSEVGKMSKSKFNVINPDQVIDRYGTDCFRMYEMFLGPIEQSKPWDTKGIDGVSRFLRKFWALFFDQQGNFQLSDETPSKEELKSLHTAIKKVNEDIERFNFNTCISAFMVASNELSKLKCNKREILEPLIILLAPFGPHIAEELWHLAGREGSVHHATYPVFDEAHLVEDSVTYPIAINGKTRATAEFPADASREELEKAAVDVEGIQKYTEGKTIRKIIVVPGRMINIVV